MCRRNYQIKQAILCCVVVSLCLPSLALAQSDTSLHLAVGIGGKLKERQYGSARVLIRHKGESKQCRLILRVIATRWGEAESIAVEDVSLPANSRKRIELPFFAEIGAEEVVAELWEGQQRIARRRVKVVPIPINDRVVCSLTPSSTGVELTHRDRFAIPNMLYSLRVSRATWNESRPHIVSVDKWDDLPATFLGLRMLDALVVVGAPPHTMTLEQQDAVLRWVAEGGVLIVSVGEDARALQQSFLARMLPGTMTGEAVTAGLRDVQIISGASQPLNEPMPVALLRPSGDILAKDSLPQMRSGQVTPLIVGRNWGRGQIVALTFNPTREPFLSWQGRKVFWSTLLRWTLPRLSSWEHSGLQWRLRELMHQAGVVRVPSRALLLTPLLLYGIVLIGAGIGVARIAGRKEKAWLVLCSIAALFSAGYYGFFRGKVRAQATLIGIAITEVAPEQRNARTTLIMELFSPAQRHLDMTVGAPHARIGAGERFGYNVSGSRSLMANHEFTPTSTRLRGEVLSPWEITQIIARFEAHLKKPLNLQALETSGTGQGGAYRFTNRDGYPLQFPRFIESGGSFTDLKNVPPGSTVTAEIKFTGRRGWRQTPSLSQLPRVRGKRAQHEQTVKWLLDLYSWEWEGGTHGHDAPCVLALTERPLPAVTLPGFQQRWFHFVHVLPEGAKRAWQSRFYTGGGIGSAKLASQTAEVTYENNDLRIGSGELVLECTHDFRPPPPGQGSVAPLNEWMMTLSGTIQGNAQVTYSAYNWETGKWLKWQPRSGTATATSPWMHKDYFFNDLLRLKIVVQGSSNSSLRLQNMSWSGKSEQRP